MKLELAQLSKEFITLRGRIAAVAAVDLTVGDGEFFVLLGPSGCGKSTLLNLIAGLEKPTAGEIRFEGEPVASDRHRIFLSPGERQVAMVFQSYALYPHLDVFGNIAFPLKIAGVGTEAINEAVRRAAEALEISELLRARPGELSGGQRQRVAIARAIVRRPRVLLLDEPLSNLDLQLRTTTRAELKRLQRELGVTTIYVTHDQTEAMTLGDRIAVMKEGRIEQVGTPEDLYHRPANPFVARFVGMPPMNLFQARMEREEESLFLVFADRRLKLPESAVMLDREPGPGEVLAGLRPEHIRLVEREEGVFEGVVEAVEPLGREILLYVRIDDDRFQVLSGEGEFRIEEVVWLAPELERLHLFSKA
jgi:multiple sugar transport system ATP-binding protein